MNILKIVAALASLYKEARGVVKDKKVYGHEVREFANELLARAFKVFKLEAKLLPMPEALVTVIKLVGVDVPSDVPSGKEVRETVALLLERAFELLKIDDKVLIDLADEPVAVKA